MGVFGHSFGGATAGEVCLHDKRFKTFINMDGAPSGEAINNIIEQPFMVMTSGPYIDAGYNKGQKNYLVVTIEGSEHFDYADFTILFPNFKYAGFLLGKIDGARQVEIVNDYVLSFFNKHLKGKKEPLIDERLNKYPEVAIRYK
jgi:pimeloyl-ACP methyl ester carboxylesterase